MDTHVFIEWFVVLAYIGMGIFAGYKYTKQNHDDKW